MSGVGGGFALYSVNNVYSWNAATGITKLLLDGNVASVLLVTGNKVYFYIGNNKTVYQITLQ